MDNLDLFFEDSKRSVLEYKEDKVLIDDSVNGTYELEKFATFEDRRDWGLDIRLGRTPFLGEGFSDWLQINGVTWQLTGVESGRDSCGSKFNWLTYEDFIVLEYGIYDNYSSAIVLKKS